MELFSRKKNKTESGLEFPPTVQIKQEATPHPPAIAQDDSSIHKISESQDISHNTSPPYNPNPMRHEPRQELGQDQLNYIVNQLKSNIVKDILEHPLFITSLVRELEMRDLLHNTILKKCLESLEAKYDITPTQIYRDKVIEAQSTLDTLNSGIEQQTQVYDSFKDALIELQHQSAQEYKNSITSITNNILDKFKL